MSDSAKLSHGLDLLDFGHKTTSLIRQSEAAECGLCCIAMVAEYYGYKTDLTYLRRRFPISMKGTTLKTLMSIADDIGLNSRPLKAEIESLSELAFPAVLHWNLNHFVVLTGVKRSINGLKYAILDPARGDPILSEAELSRFYTGVAIEFHPSERFQRKTERAPLKITQMWTRVVGLNTTLVQVLALSLLLQLFAFAGPFYMQLAVDTAIPSFDSDFLLALAMGFGGIALLNLATTTVRDLVLLKLGSTLGYQLVSNLFRQLVRLPMGYFEKRHTGDIISRFDSTQPITDLLSKGLISALIDGMMALLTLALMFYYSAILSGVCVAAVVIYVIVRAAYFNSLQLANVSLIAARASESSTMIETVRGMAAIKLFAREGDRHRFWLKKRANVVNANVKLGTMQVWFDLTNNAVLGLENILFVYLAVKMTMDAKFTIGMIFAFQAYKQQFVGATTRLVAQWIQWKILDVHLGRIADIALSPGESEGANSSVTRLDRPKGKIDVHNLHFAYARGEEEVLKGVNLSIAAGETVAIIGPSGGGKTTLLKLLVGLYPPDYGKIMIDEQPLEHLGLNYYRSHIGTVMQDDVLYAGTLAENIGFFDSELNMKHVKAVAKLACIHDEIMAMPMGYESLVGDMGSTLSGGQKQRVLLARALYPEPRILFLDEGTAHLDVRMESAVNASINNLGITRIVIAHRPETIHMADRAVALVGGKIIEQVEGVLSTKYLT